jgi:hypothetical protein
MSCDGLTVSRMKDPVAFRLPCPRPKPARFGFLNVIPEIIAMAVRAKGDPVRHYHLLRVPGNFTKEHAAGQGRRSLPEGGGRP